MAVGYRTASGQSIITSLERYGDKAFKRLGRGLYREGQGIMAQSRPLVPVDTGALRGSGYVDQPYYNGDKVRVELGYGGVAAQINPKTGENTDGYALLVHENLEAFHRVGIAKYLELPFNQASQGMTGRLADDLRNKFDDNVGDFVVDGGAGPEAEYVF